MRNEKGIGLVEVLISLAILGVITIAFFTALSASSQAGAIAERQEKGRNLAQSVMDYVMGLSYNATSGVGNNNSLITYRPYQPLPPAYSGYNVTVNTTLLTDNISTTVAQLQMITVVVRQAGVTAPITTLVGYKVDR